MHDGLVVVRFAKRVDIARSFLVEVIHFFGRNMFPHDTDMLVSIWPFHRPRRQSADNVTSSFYTVQ